MRVVSAQCEYWTDSVQGLKAERWCCVLPAGRAGYHHTDLQRKVGEVAASPEPVPARQPDGYAYRYPDGIRFETGGARINGNRPSEAIPYFFGTSQQLKS